MEQEELERITAAVITHLKNNSVDVSVAKEILSKQDVLSFVGYDKENNVVRISPNVVEGGAVYLTEAEYNYLVENNKIDDNVEYNIYEDE